MKTIIFIRHAKSDWSSPQLSDFDRPLNKRGLRDAPNMGARLLSIKPDLILLSSSKRTRQTIDIIAENARWNKVQRIEKDALYLASEKTYLNELSEIDNSFQTLVICGHNPGITSVINSLSGENFGNVPTCGLAIIQFEVNLWRAISMNSGSLVHYDFPKNI